ncbi:MAG: LPS-assembly protein LptD [Alistipes sp.]|nr:LPS-assembly protein LptD [Alistipes sp.]MBR3591186.1 LPS-assembly protein LptD [Alistipes sp.]
MRPIYAKYLLSTLLVVVLFCLLSGLSEVGARGYRAIFAQDSVKVSRAERDTLGPLSTSTESAALIPNMRSEMPPVPRRSADSSRMRTTEPTTAKQESATPAEPTTKRGAMFDDIIEGKAVDSVVFDARNKMIYSYRDGDVTYQGMNLKADYMRVDMQTKDIFAHGFSDTTETGEPMQTKPEFSDGGAPYAMDTITYNLDSRKALIKGIATQQGDGWLIGNRVKMQPDESIHIRDGLYTTCDCTDHPHFYINMTQAKVIPGKKIIAGYSYLVMEDVPIYFPGIPEAFFPVQTGPKSGILMPTYGEDAKGFFIRDLGYYFTLGEHMDLAIRGGIYTLGSWEVSAVSQYVKRYKFRGNFNLSYSSIRTGEKGQPDYVNQNNYRIQWSHSQDAKANPGSTFSASVNLTSSGYSRYSATTVNDILATQTNSSISYSKNWEGTPFSLSLNLAASQNSRDKTISVTLPTITFNVASFNPFKRKEAVGKTRWYEKIKMSYSMKMTNTVSAKEDTIFTKETLNKMKNGIQHTIPVSTSLTLFNYINVSPSFNYTERWYFKKVSQQWNNETKTVDTLDPEYGFWRIYNYNASVSANTTIYGTYTAKKKERKLQAVRHTLTPNIGFAYSPDFSRQRYGFYETVQTDTTGRFKVYSPFTDNAYGVPGSGQQFNLTFGLSQSLEAKVRTKDTVKKVKIIDQISISGSYNFLADSMRLSNLPIQLRTTIYQNIGLNLSLTLDPYEVSPQGVRYNKLMWARGLPGRIQSVSWSFGYSFKSREDKSQVAGNDITSYPAEYFNAWSDPYGQLNPAMRRQWMAGQYYDFSIPWNLGFNYSISYNAQYVNNGTTGYRKKINQTLSVNGSVRLTPKTMITATTGYDFASRKMSMTSISITRDLHCWQMSFMWIPFGNHKSWSFNIGVKAASLADLKYDKSYTQYDNMY